MSDAGPDRLYSWKEIAGYLEVSVRTAQLWERDRGLPVHRLPGPRGRAWALVSEVEAWLDGEHHRTEPEPAPGRRRRPGALAVGAVAVAAIALAWVWALSGPGSPVPARAAVTPEGLVVFDTAGCRLWTATFAQPLWLDRYQRMPGLLPTFADIDADGAIEVVFAAAYADRSVPNVLHVFDHNGDRRWTHRPGLPVSTATEQFEKVYWTSAIGLLPQADGTQDILLAAHHHIFYPSVLTRLSASGEVRSSLRSAVNAFRG